MENIENLKQALGSCKPASRQFVAYFNGIPNAYSPDDLFHYHHNHPAGGLIPSRKDIQITKRLKAAGETLGIKLLDHIIFNHKGYFSFLEKGEIL